MKLHLQEAVVIIISLLVGFLSQSCFGQATYQNPVFNSDFPDLFVLRINNSFFAFATSSNGAHIPVLTSSDLSHWRLAGEALPNVPGWSTPGWTWAPTVLPLGGNKYAMYYTTRHTSSNKQCISVAVSSMGPQGPYIDSSSTPFVCQLNIGASIDPSARYFGGRPYLIWKNDGNCCGQKVSIYGQELRPDGLALVGNLAELITADQAWESNLIEGPAMWQHGSLHYLLYSASDYQSYKYAVGYATCTSPLGPCSKPAFAPIMAFYGHVWGPGGEEIFNDTKGNVWVCYHAWTAPVAGYPQGKRSLRIDKVTFDQYNRIIINGPTEFPEPM